MRGKFITFEGSEGSGKSTQAELAFKYLIRKGRKALLIREPGGTKISEAIRKVLLDIKNTSMTDECETLLYMAARAQLVNQIILPALNKGKIVLCDRFLDSTLAYQGYGNGVNKKMIQRLGRFVTQGLSPDLTLLFCIETEQGLSRTGTKKDRIEQRSIQYHQRVHQGYLKLAKAEPQRIKVIPVNQGKEGIHKIVRHYLNQLLEKRV